MAWRTIADSDTRAGDLRPQRLESSLAIECENACGPSPRKAHKTKVAEPLPRQGRALRTAESRSTWKFTEGILQVVQGRALDLTALTWDMAGVEVIHLAGNALQNLIETDNLLRSRKVFR